ncbi:flagellar assembly protein FliH [Bacillus sp. REN10]|uniref:flagellar assembly protein FliH n=1 Tax=Bacillus sp. REN10 TaxID=2782541 RepID=UPI00193B8D9D|nr:flagellar assembly protein FliH [Bacillus sp. REN10]
MSRLIKSQRTEIQIESEKIIEIKVIQSEKELDTEQQKAESQQTAWLEAEKQKKLDEAYIEANSMIQQAREESEKIRTQVNEEKQAWDEEKKRLIAEAHEEGVTVGIQEGQQLGYSEYEQLIKAAKQTVASSQQEYQNNVQQAEKTIVHLAMQVAEKVLRQVVKEQPNTFLPVVQQALKEVYDQREIQIHVHPIHYPLVVEQKAELEAMFPVDTLVYIYPNEELQENGCYIDTKQGRIDVGIDSQLWQLRTQLFELLEGEKQ